MAGNADGTTGGVATAGESGDGDAAQDDGRAGDETAGRADQGDGDGDGDDGADGGDGDDGADGGDADDGADADAGDDGVDGGDDGGDGVDGGDADAGDGGGDGGADGGDADAGDGGDGAAVDTGGDGPGGDAGDGGSAGPGDDGGAGGEDGGDDGPAGDGGDAGGDDGPAGDGGDDGGDGGGGEDEACAVTHAPLLAGQWTTAGDVDISITDDGVLVHVDAHAPWTLEHVHVYVGVDLPPSGGGGLIPGQFPYSEALDSASEYSLLVPWDLVGGACGETIHVAVHAEATKIVEGMLIEKETAWAAGPESTGAGWSSWLDATICCE